jgi:multicomponent Na+:H+ antiporter subunit G
MDVLAALLLTAGVLLMLIAAIGIIRLRDPLQRMHSATKAGTLGVVMLITGVLIGTDGAPVMTGVLAILFLMFTLPLAAQLLGRATYLSGATLVEIEKTAIPDLKPPGKEATSSEGETPAPE